MREYFQSFLSALGRIREREKKSFFFFGLIKLQQFFFPEVEVEVVVVSPAESFGKTVLMMRHVTAYNLPSESFFLLVFLLFQDGLGFCSSTRA